MMERVLPEGSKQIRDFCGYDVDVKVADHISNCVVKVSHGEERNIAEMRHRLYKGADRVTFALQFIEGELRNEFHVVNGDLRYHTDYDIAEADVWKDNGPAFMLKQAIIQKEMTTDEDEAHVTARHIHFVDHLKKWNEESSRDGVLVCDNYGRVQSPRDIVHHPWFVEIFRGEEEEYICPMYAEETSFT